jgi:predicted glutamine amidotransferase
VTERPTSAIDGLGAESFQAFTSLSAVHGDGWGMAWRESGGNGTKATTSPISAAHDPRYADLATRELGDAGLVHLRWATDGLTVKPENTHPFTSGGYAFAHNGSIAPIDKLEALLSEHSLTALEGDTDSERYFRFVVQRVQEAGDERAGVTGAVALLRDYFPDASLNGLLLSPTHLFAVHVNSTAQTPLDDLRELFGSEEAMPVGHATNYFDMSYRHSPDAVHVVSSGLAEDGWSPLPPDSVLAVDLNTRQIDILNLD